MTASSSHNFIASKLGMKRSFNCPDLCSISDSVGAVDAAGLDTDRQEHDYYQQPAKRRRADSTASSCSAVCDCCWEEDRTSCKESLFLPHSSATMQPSFSSATHAVTPELAPVKMPSSEELRVAPNFPSLKGLKKNSSSCVDDCPATAALERFMLPQKSADDGGVGDFARFSFDEHPCDDSHSTSWSKQDNDESLHFPRKFDSAVLPSQQEVDDGDRRPRTVSFSSRMPSLASVSDSSWSSRTHDSVSADSSLLSMLSSCTLEPTKKTKRSITTVTELAPCKYPTSTSSKGI
eukprot:scaffold1868_cov165-Skeletonema_menzelii.AAC.4